MTKLVLHGYWRSTAVYRVRIGLHLKGLEFDQAPVDLSKGAQHAADYLKIAPQGLVPSLETEEGVLTQSVAILEWLEERWPRPALLPASPGERAIVRAMAQIVACDIHPLNNLRVQTHLRESLAATSEHLSVWTGRWIREGFAALETLIARYGGDFAFGDRPSLADCMLIPQVYSARRFATPLDDFPLIRVIDARARSHPAFVAAAPEAQADALPV